MSVITNAKVAGLEPVWAPYRGFSLLFDNPGESVSPMGEGLARLNCSVNTSSSLQLYSALAGLLDKIGRDLLMNTYLFCPLPSYSYHVTVWDGPNDGNARNVPPRYRPNLEDFLAGLPNSLLGNNGFTTEVYDSPLVLRRGWTLEFKFDRLTKWGNQVLVARLAPADKDSEATLRGITADRTDLTTDLQERFGVKTTNGYSPHVSLGYFANREFADLSTPQIDHWTDMVKKEAGNLTITFSSISLYGFTDMATFFKKAPGTAQWKEPHA